MYVVDGYNLLHALKKLPDGLPEDFGRARARVVELISHLCKREGVKARIFFDGTPGELGTGDLAYPRVKVIFCGPEREAADHAVRDYAENAGQPRNITVVSSDQEVVKACKLAGTKTLSSQAMAKKLDAAMPATSEPTGPEKPIRGAIGKLEQEMLDEIGDFEEFKRKLGG
ncbi:MAG: NYN domain-containing protein [Planctomycetes bacterium]|nr:NYN domain-containing protein [Planctomycetota bacterium]